MARRMPANTTGARARASRLFLCGPLAAAHLSFTTTSTGVHAVSLVQSRLEQRNKDNQPAAVGGAGSAAHQGSSGSSSDEDTYLAHLRSGAPPPVDQSAELEAATAQREQEMEKFGKMLPYRPRRRPFAMFKESCLSFVEDKAEKCGYNAERLHFFMPKCTWGAELCAVLLEKLKSVVAVMGAESAAGAGGAGSGMLGSGSAGAMGSVSEGAAAAAAPSGGSVGAMKMMAGGGAGSGSGVVLGSLMGSGGMEEDGPPKSSPADGFCGQMFHMLQQRRMHEAIKEIVGEELKHKSKAAVGSGSAQGSGPAP